MKTKSVRANVAPYMTKTLRTAIMRRTALKNKLIHGNSPGIKEAYKKQKNDCSRQYKKERKRFYNNLNLKDYAENKVFWKMVKPFLSDKSNSSNKITLVEDDEIISEDKKVSEIFNSYFADTVEQLNVGGNIFLLNLTGDSLDPIETIIKRYDLHPSILGIKEHVSKEVFS